MSEFLSQNEDWIRPAESECLFGVQHEPVTFVPGQHVVKGFHGYEDRREVLADMLQTAFGSDCSVDHALHFLPSSEYEVSYTIKSLTLSGPAEAMTITITLIDNTRIVLQRSGNAGTVESMRI